MAISEKDVKLLWGRAAGHCSRPDCRLPLTASSIDGEYHLGEQAHMIPDSSTGPRSSEATGDEDTDAYDNHILLCPTCHTLVDKNPSQYPAATLRSWKTEHEAWVAEQLSRALQYVSFVELERVCEGILNATESVGSSELNLDLVPPIEKMDKNGLTARTHNLISMGLSQAAHVRKFLEDQEEIDPDFPDRLVLGFRRQYHLALARGIDGDDLFQHLATHKSSDLSLQATQIAVVSYLFHACDVFES